MLANGETQMNLFTGRRLEPKLPRSICFKIYLNWAMAYSCRYDISVTVTDCLTIMARLQPFIAFITSAMDCTISHRLLDVTWQSMI